MTAIETLLAGLIDYAGLYPPAALDMRSAVSNYLTYRRGPHAFALGRFVVSLDRIPELRSAAGGSFSEMKLSVIVPADTALDALPRVLGDDFGLAALEFKINRGAEIERINTRVPTHHDCYFEIPIGDHHEELLDAVAACGARAKLRMGGVIAEAFPTAKTTAMMLKALADRHLPFKATAGLHHPVRSRHPLTYESDAPSGMMHGFVNLTCAAALLYFGGTEVEALRTLEEEGPGAWRMEPDAIRCEAFRWTTDQISEARKKFMISFGSCSFTEPIRDLEVLEWL
ncbi:MAG: hypothetical protein WB561_17820 [Terracidiphilus sp.]